MEIGEQIKLTTGVRHSLGTFNERWRSRPEEDWLDSWSWLAVRTGGAVADRNILTSQIAADVGAEKIGAVVQEMRF